MELTPKQKAEELVNKYIPHIAGADRYNSTLGIYDKKISKQCALIAIDEIMDVCPYIDEKIRENEDQLLAFSFQFVSYWQGVKEELLKM